MNMRIERVVAIDNERESKMIMRAIDSNVRERQIYDWEKKIRLK